MCNTCCRHKGPLRRLPRRHAEDHRAVLLAAAVAQRAPSLTGTYSLMGTKLFTGYLAQWVPGLTVYLAF